MSMLLITILCNDVSSKCSALGGLLVLSACASQTLNPDQAPEYVITRNFTPFYTERPVPGATTDISLQEKTRVKLLRKGTRYSLVQA